MKDSLLPSISDITELLKKEDISEQSSGKLRELLENLSSYYMGLNDSKPLNNSITGDGQAMLTKVFFLFIHSLPIKFKLFTICYKANKAWFYNLSKMFNHI